MIEPRDIKEKIQLFRHSPQQPIYRQNLLMSHEEPEYIINNHKDSYLKLGNAHIADTDLGGNTHYDEAFYPLSANIQLLPVELDNPILANGFYYFMTIIVVLILVSAISFGVREYSFAFRRRIKSSTSEAIKLTNWNDIKGAITSTTETTNNINSIRQKIMNRIKEEENNDRSRVGVDGSGDDQADLGIDIRVGKAGGGTDRPIMILQNNSAPIHHVSDLSSKNNMESGFTQFMEKGQHNDTTEWECERFQSAELNEETLTKSEGKDCYGNDYNTGITEKSISKFARQQSLKLPHPPLKPVYSIGFLKGIDKSTTPISEVLINISKFKQKKKIPMSSLLSCSVGFPRTCFDNAWQASKVIREAESIILTTTCKVSRLLLLVQLLSVGKSIELLDNPNIFLEAFNDCIENLVDMGYVFNFFSESSVVLKLLLMENLLTYSWSHYRFHDLENKSRIIKVQFEKWNLPHPIVQTRNTIFKILCNLQLGLNTSCISTTTEQAEIENGLKLGLVIREVINHSVCNDYIGYMPMIAQAIDISTVDRNKFFFYEILKLLIVKHGKCCMGEYIQESNIELKTLVQFGMTTNQIPIINDKVKEILEMLIKIDGKIISWKNMTATNNNYIASAIPLSTEHTENYFSAPLFRQPQKQQDHLEKQPNRLPLLDSELTSGSTLETFANSWKLGVVSSDINYSQETIENQHQYHYNRG